MKKLSDYVNVFQGSGEINLPKPEGLAKKWLFIKAQCGNTTPSAAYPFGKATVCAYTGGYPTGYGDRQPNSCGRPRKIDAKVHGFSHMHVSGTGAIRDYYNYAVTFSIPSNELKAISEDFVSEKAHPGYYSATLSNGTRFAGTVSKKIALHRYSMSCEGLLAIDFSNDGLVRGEGEFSKRFFSYPDDLEVKIISENTVTAHGKFHGIDLYFAAYCKDSRGAFLWEDYEIKPANTIRHTNKELRCGADGETVTAALRDYYSIFEDRALVWLGNLYNKEIGGKRGMWKGQPLNTNFCMSNPKARKKYAYHVADYAQNHSNSDYLHLWLADDFNNHCECESCQQKTASDWYMMVMNDTDEELTRRGLDTRLVFIAYQDTAWAPKVETLKNPDRFTMLLAPISRSYAETLPEGGLTSKPTEYVRNKIQRPRNLEEYLVLFEEWKKNWHGANMSYEYHFWRPQCFDLSGIVLAKRVYEDILAYKSFDINGIIEDGSQRSFFPNGFAFYTYARCLFDNSTPFEQIAEDYYSHIYGEDWKEIYSYLEKIAELIPYTYLHGARPKAPYAPELKANFEEVKRSCLEMKERLNKSYRSPVRVQTVSKILLKYHADFCILLCDALVEKCVGNNVKR